MIEGCHQGTLKSLGARLAAGLRTWLWLGWTCDRHRGVGGWWSQRQRVRKEQGWGSENHTEKSVVKVPPPLLDLSFTGNKLLLSARTAWNQAYTQPSLGRHALVQLSKQFGSRLAPGTNSSPQNSLSLVFAPLSPWSCRRRRRSIEAHRRVAIN